MRHKKLPINITDELPAFVADVKRRTVSLFGGPFRCMSVKLAIAVLEEFEPTTIEKFFEKEVIDAIEKRSGSFSSQINAKELSYLLTPHDLKRMPMMVLPFIGNAKRN